MAEGKITSLSTTLVAQLQPGGTSRSTITGLSPDTWFGPGQPLAPMAPQGTGGRQFDYRFGENLNYTPRNMEAIGFQDLRALADNLPILRAVIETRKDQIAAMPTNIRVIPDPDAPTRGRSQLNAAQKSRIADIKAFLRRPDRINSFETWLRMLLEDMLVCDCATIYPRPTLGGDVFSLDVIDGATIKPLLNADGRRPDAPDPAFQQILKGIVAADFTQDELLYLPRNVRSNRVYGFSPVEQVVLTANIALRRDTSTLEYYRSGSVPDAFGTLPKEWTSDQIKSFQNYFDDLMMGNTQARRGLRFMPSDFKYQEAKAPALKDQYDEWLARVVCYAFSVPATPFVAVNNRATAESQRLQASQEGLVPLQQWIKHAMDHVVQVLLAEPDLEFCWSDGDQIDPNEQMTVLTGYVACGGMNRDEMRDELGLGPIPNGEGQDYTVSGPALNPARLETPEEQQAKAQQAMDLMQAKQPNPGADKPGGKSSETPDNQGGQGDAQKLLKDAESAQDQPRDYHGRFASTGSPKPASTDKRPRDANGQFIPRGGSSRGAYTLAARRKRLLEGVKTATERAVVGAALIGGAMLVTAAFAPEAAGAILTVGIVRAVGTAAIGDAASTAINSTLEYLNVPASMRESIHSAVQIGLGVYGVAEAKTNFDTFMASNVPAAATAVATKAVETASRADAISAVQAVLYSVGQDVIAQVKAKAAAKAGKGDGAKLAVINDGLESTLEDFLDAVDALGGTHHPDGGDPGSAKGDPQTDVSDHPAAAQKVAKSGEGSIFAAGVMFLTDDDKVLYLKRTGDCPHTGTWCMPGGKVDPGENAQQAAVREADEEAGVLASITLTPDMLGEPIALNVIGDSGRQFACFLHRVPAAFDCSIDTEESSEYVWAPFDEPPQPAHPGVTKILEMARALPPVEKLAKSVNWKILEPMWQKPTAEKRSVRAFRKTLSSALGITRTAVVANVRAELTKLGKADKPDVEALAQQVAGQIPLDGLSDAAGDLADTVEAAASDIAEGALARIGVGDDEGIVEKVSARAVAVARERAAELVGMRWDKTSETFIENPNPQFAITDSTRDMIRTIIANGLEENLSADDIADNIEGSTAFSPERADLVAMTEITRVNSDAALTAYQTATEAGVKVKKKWIVAAVDVCDDCTKNAQQDPIDLDQAFQSGDMATPAHPRCRCSVAPCIVSDNEEEIPDDAEE